MGGLVPVARGSDSIAPAASRHLGQHQPPHVHLGQHQPPHGTWASTSRLPGTTRPQIQPAHPHKSRVNAPSTRL